MTGGWQGTLVTVFYREAAAFCSLASSFLATLTQWSRVHGSLFFEHFKCGDEAEEACGALASQTRRVFPYLCLHSRRCWEHKPSTNVSVGFLTTSHVG